MAHSDACPSDFLCVLPPLLPCGEPYYYLSERQRRRCEQEPRLRRYASFLPGWVPHRVVAEALGHGCSGVDAALRRLGPYVWGTEFENVHTTWAFSEPSFEVEGRRYECSEHFFHAQKRTPFDAAEWDCRRDSVMRTAVSMKFQDPELRRLLLSTHPHPLLSIKGDHYWGVSPSGKGCNKLAEILMELRSFLREERELEDTRCSNLVECSPEESSSARLQTSLEEVENSDPLTNSM